MQVFNTESPSVVYGLLGLKLYFYYVPLMFVGYALIDTNRDLERLLMFNLGPGTHHRRAGHHPVHFGPRPS